MGDPRELKRLLEELQGIASPVRRVKLLARAWRSLRRLDRSELQRLAAHTGLERAEELLNGLAKSRGHVSSGLLMQAVRKLSNVDVAQAGELVSDLKDPEKRKEMLRRGLDVLERGLEHADTTAAGRPAVSEPLPAEETPGRSKPTVGEGRRETALDAGPPGPSTRPPAEMRPAIHDTTLAPTAERATRPQAAAAVRTAAVPLSVPRPVSREKRRRPPRARDRVATERREIDLVSRVERGASAFARLRTLSRELPHSRELDGKQLREVLDAFPVGWARRRALCAMFREGLPARLDEALELIEHLESPLARRWCAGELLDRRDVPHAVRAALVDRYGLYRHRRRRHARH